MAPSNLIFGEYELDSSVFELRRHGRRIRLERKPLELLILLAEKHDRLVSREEIIERLWGKDFFFDAERGINNAIRKIRAALNDDADKPRFVETVVGKGYRFIAAIGQAQEPIHSPAPAPGAIRERPRGFRWKLVWIPTFTVAALIAGLFVFDTAGIRSRVLAPRAPAIHSMVVLPLENLSGDPSQEYFVDGMTDALITELARFDSLRVISRTSAMHYKGSRQPLPKIAHELNVDAVLEGSVVRSGNRVRITAQLIDARSDRHLWSQAYDRDIQDVLSLQQDVADSIVNEIQVKLIAQGGARSKPKRQVDPAAYDDYLRGMYFWHKFTEAGTRRANEYFEASVSKDPTFALGFAGLSNAYHELAGYVDPKEFMPKSEQAALRAVQLDDTLAEAHTSLGYIKWVYDRDWPGAEREFRRAIQLNPGNAMSHGEYAKYLNSMGRFEEALREHELARERDPVALILIGDVGDHFMVLRQYDKAIEEYRRMLEMDPSFADAHAMLAIIYKSEGRERESISELEQAAIGEGKPDLAEAMRNGYARGGYKGALKARLKFNQRRRSAGVHLDYWDDAWTHAQLGNRDLAMQALEKAYAERSNLVWLNLDPEWDPLRADPRFQDLVRRIGLPVRTGPGLEPH